MDQDLSLPLFNCVIGPLIRFDLEQAQKCQTTKHDDYFRIAASEFWFRYKSLNK